MTFLSGCGSNSTTSTESLSSSSQYSLSSKSSEKSSSESSHEISSSSLPLLAPVIMVNGKAISLIHPAYFLNESVMVDVVEMGKPLSYTSDISDDGNVCFLNKGNLMIIVEQGLKEFVVNDLSARTSQKYPFKEAAKKTEYGIDVSVEELAMALGYKITKEREVINFSI